MVDVEDRDDENTSSDRQLDLVEHLAELRTRLVRSVLYVGLAAIAGWVFYPFFFALLSKPVAPVLKGGSKFLLTGVAEGFSIKMQIALLTGVIMAMPLLTLEGWRFVSPGLTKKEKKGIRLVGPLSILLFAAGVCVAYTILPVGIQWLVSQNPPGATFMPSVAQTLLFVLKMCLAFGLVFQLPVVLMFLAKVGIVDSRMLKSYWRQAVVVLAIVAAVVTPSADAFSMMLMCAPLIVLYGLSIVLVKTVER